MTRIAVCCLVCFFTGFFVSVAPQQAPGCQFATFWINCYYINADNVQQVEDSLTLASDLFRHYSLAFYYSTITVLPEDLLEGYVLDEILFQDNDDILHIPAMLSNANANLSGLSFSRERIASLSKQELDLPFSRSLQHLYFIDCPIQNIEEGTFTNYSSLRELWLEGNQLAILEADSLRGAVALQSLVLFNGTLTRVEVGAFQDKNSLLELELDYNRLSFLDEGSFDGLSRNPMVFLYDNPFNCTCELQWLKNWLNESNQLESSGAACTSPVIAPFAQVDFCASFDQVAPV